VHRDVKPPNILVVETDDGKGTSAKITDFGIARFSPAEQLPGGPGVQTGERGDADPSDLDTVAQTQRTPSRTPRAQPSTGDTGLFTRSGKLAGTPLYMAPELAVRGAKASPKADVYSLGVLAWELLAKRRPSLRPAAAAVLAGETPDPLPSLLPIAVHAPAEVSHAIDACLQFDPDERPSCAELEGVFATALSRMLEGAPQS
jgi:serine/threonine protein kinase